MTTPNVSNMTTDRPTFQLVIQSDRADASADVRKITQTMAKPKYAAGASKSAIQAATGLNPKQFGLALEQLLEVEAITTTEIKVSNHKTPQVGYKLAETTQC